MFESIMRIFKKLSKKEEKTSNSKDAAKERLHLVLMQDRANVSADFLELMKQEIIEVIKKYIDIDEKAIDVRLTNKENEDGTNGAPALYANIPILNIKNEARKIEVKENKKEPEKTEKKETPKIEKKEERKEKLEEKEKEEEQKEEQKQEDIVIIESNEKEQQEAKEQGNINISEEELKKEEKATNDEKQEEKKANEKIKSKN